MAKKLHAIYVIQEGQNGKKYWCKCGAAWENQDGSFNLKLDLFPQLDMQLREVVPREDEQHQDERPRSAQLRQSRDDIPQSNGRDTRRNGSGGR